MGIADTEKGEVPEAQDLDFEVEMLYKEEKVQEEGFIKDAANPGEYSLVDVKGIGDGTAKNLAKNDVTSVDALLNSDPEQLASKISEISSKMINEWQTNAKALLSA